MKLTVNKTETHEWPFCHSTAAVVTVVRVSTESTTIEINATVYHIIIHTYISK